MGIMDNIKNFVAPVEDDEEEYEQEPVQQQAQQPVVEQEPQTRYERPKRQSASTTLNANTKMVLFEPRSFGEAEEVGTRLKEGRAVVVNLHKLDREYA
ncbi:MAG: cell division protein SepF, partial [Erysipelotrichaceae bacterium]|nr:cell division protein SepF [Erysipelotrichaceae bacterium]